MLSSRIAQRLAVSGLIVLGAQAVAAQSCIGLGSLKGVKRSVSTYAGGVGAERLALGRFGISGARAFGGVQAGYGGNSGLNHPETTVLGLDAGLTFPVGTTGIEVCPLVQSLYERGRAFEGERNHNLYNSAGLGIGRPIRITNSFAIVPFADARVLVLTRINTVTFASAYSIERGNFTRVGSQLGAGIGLQFKDVLTIRPAVGTRQGFGHFDDQGAMSLSVSYNFRR